MCWVMIIWWETCHKRHLVWTSQAALNSFTWVFSPIYTCVLLFHTHSILFCPTLLSIVASLVSCSIHNKSFLRLWTSALSWCWTHLQLLHGPTVVHRHRVNAQKKVQMQDAAANQRSSHHLLLRLNRRAGRGRANAAAEQGAVLREWRQGIWACPGFLCPFQMTLFYELPKALQQLTWFNPFLSHSTATNGKYQ